GGDLRIGLAMQSVHDGQQWMHQPQRLAVYIAAPREPIERITAKHDNVRHLVDNEWLYLLRWSDDQRIERYYQGQWTSQA
ncbi:MAG: putative inorganic carbon transporter subunit DabA, partial [Reinekea sp.]|nr:putative inorganic carbon transporter subunit DabA [Reinekea sp.]